MKVHFTTHRGRLANLVGISNV